MRFALDNSVVMRWLLRDGSEDRIRYADRVLDLLTQDTNEAVVPGLWALEAANVIVKAQAKMLVSESRASAFIGLLTAMSFTTDTLTSARALGDTLQLARRFKLSSYDASYLELAMRTGLPLATLDGDLRTAMAIVGTELV